MKLRSVRKAAPAATAGRSSTGDPVRDTIAEWLPADAVERAYSDAFPILHDYLHLSRAGTKLERAKIADEQLQDIEKHARALARLLDAMNPRARSAMHAYRYMERNEPGVYADWLASFGNLESLADAAKGARKHLPARPSGKGRTRKTGPTPQELLAQSLAAIYLDHGDSKRQRRRGDEVPAHAFARAVAASIGITLPEDIGKLLRAR